MVRRRASYGVRAVKQRVQDGLVLYSDHARQEMDDDDLNEADVRIAVVRGSLVARQTHGARGTRYVLRGLAVDGRPIQVVCRLFGENVRIVTVFQV